MVVWGKTGAGEAIRELDRGNGAGQLEVPLYKKELAETRSTDKKGTLQEKKRIGCFGATAINHQSTTKPSPEGDRGFDPALMVGRNKLEKTP